MIDIFANTAKDYLIYLDNKCPFCFYKIQVSNYFFQCSYYKNKCGYIVYGNGPDFIIHKVWFYNININNDIFCIVVTKNFAELILDFPFSNLIIKIPNKYTGISLAKMKDLYTEKFKILYSLT